MSRYPQNDEERRLGLIPVAVDVADRRAFYRRVIAEIRLNPRGAEQRIQVRWTGAEGFIEAPLIRIEPHPVSTVVDIEREEAACDPLAVLEPREDEARPKAARRSDMNATVAGMSGGPRTARRAARSRDFDISAGDGAGRRGKSGRVGLENRLELELRCSLRVFLQRRFPLLHELMRARCRDSRSEPLKLGRVHPRLAEANTRHHPAGRTRCLSQLDE